MRIAMVFFLLLSVASGSFAQTGFFVTARNGTAAEVEAAIKGGASLNARDMDEGATALLLAAKYNHDPSVIALLVKAGARTEDRDSADGATALMRAAGWNANPEVVSALLKAGARIDARDQYNFKTPLMFAAMYSINPQVIMVLLSAGADASLKSYKGLTAYDYACRNPALAGTEALAELGKRL